MNTIVIPLDGSALAEAILPYARALAPLLNARLRLVEVVTEPADEVASGAGLTVLYSPGDVLEHDRSRQRWELEEAFARGETYMERQTLQLQNAGLLTQSDVLGGQPAEVI